MSTQGVDDDSAATIHKTGGGGQQLVLDIDLLRLQQRIRISIEMSESHFREFKSAMAGPADNRSERDARAVAKDIGEALVAFANADGGELLVGVEDDGTVSEVPYKPATITLLLEAPRNNVHAETPLESPVLRLVELDGIPILYFAVAKSVSHIHLTTDGRCLQRRDRETIPVTFEKLQIERQEQISREYDRQFVDGATALDLDLDLVRRAGEIVSKGLSPEKCLQLLDLAEYGPGILRLRRAALLLFAREISRWHPRCGARIMRVRGTELKTGRDYNAGPEDVAVGNIFELMTTAWEKLRPHLVETKFAPEQLFKEQVMYPEDACREALTNAIAHRDYSIEGRGIEILVFDDRMEVHSPGQLLSSVTVEDLRKLAGTHQSRNALVARVLKETGYMREMGEGIRRIYLLMKEHDLVAPELRSSGSQFTITLNHKSVFSDADQRWLNGFGGLKLTREEMLVALLGKDGNDISVQQILDTLQLVDIDDYRLVVDQMQMKGLLRRIKPRGQGGRTAVAKRKEPRFTLRQPEECEAGVSDLIAALGASPPARVITRQYARDLTAKLPDGHPYSEDWIHLAPLLRILGLMDEQNRPTQFLEGIWAAQRRHISGPPRTAVAMPPARPARAPATLKEERIAVEVPPKASASVRTSPPQRDLYVGNLGEDVTPSDIRELFRNHGPIKTLHIPRDVLTGQGRGFAFVGLARESDAIRALSDLNGTQLKGHAVRLDWGAKLRRY